MRSYRHALLAVAASLAALTGILLVPASASAQPATTSATSVTHVSAWRTAVEVPGLGRLNEGGAAYVTSVSCASAAYCAAGGFYLNGSHTSQGFVVSETKGRWGKAVEVPGLGALNTGGNAAVLSVSCAPAGNCAAGGTYVHLSGPSVEMEGFVVSERNGSWGTAVEVPGLGVLNKGSDAEVNAVSCASGNCAAGGYYKDGSNLNQGFVVSERNGRWSAAVEVPRLGRLNKLGDASVSSVSCASGNCAAGGYYLDGSDHFQGFVVSERNGTWRTVVRVPGLARLNKRGGAAVVSVSCAPAAYCAAGGYYLDGSDHEQAFVASERNGTWRTAVRVPGLARLNERGAAGVWSVSCASPGNCAAGGFYEDRSNLNQGFVVSEKNGTWRTAVEVPGLGKLNHGNAAVLSVSCASGNCAAGGYYLDGSDHGQGFVVSARNGSWGTAVEVPGLGRLNKDFDAQVSSVSCASAGNCAAGGYYADDGQEGFVVSRT